MAKRDPITVDIGDEVDRPIRFSMAYCNDLKKKYGSIAEMFRKLDSEENLHVIVHDGLIVKNITPEEILEKMDASLTLEVGLKILWALTGTKVDPPSTRTVDAKNAQTPTVQ